MGGPQAILTKPLHVSAVSAVNVHPKLKVKRHLPGLAMVQLSQPWRVICTIGL